MAWVYLLTAGLLEITCTTIFRFTDGMTKLVPTVSFFALGFVSFYFLNRSLTGIPLGTAYAVWTGIGAAGTAVVGMLFYQEPVDALRLLFLTMLIGSIAGLKFLVPG